MRVDLSYLTLGRYKVRLCLIVNHNEKTGRLFIKLVGDGRIQLGTYMLCNYSLY